MTTPSKLLEEETTGAIIGSFYDVHGALGFGYRELIYAAALERELRARGREVRRNVPVLIYYRDAPLAKQVFDMIVDKKVIVEIKATERLPFGTDRQVFSYLCSSTIEVGLVLHFGRQAYFHRVICENRYKRFSRQPE